MATTAGMQPDSGGLEDPVASEGAAPELTDEYLGKQVHRPSAPGEDQESTETHWSSKLPEEVRKHLEGKGWLGEDPIAALAAVAEGQRTTEASFHQQLQSNQELEEALANMVTEQPASPQMSAAQLGQEPDEFDITLAQYQQAVTDGSISPEQGVPVLFEAFMKKLEGTIDSRLGQVEERIVGEHVQPLENKRWEDHWVNESAALQSELGAETYARLAPRAKALVREQVESNPTSRTDPNTMRAAFGRALLEQQKQSQLERRAETLNGGASGGGPRSSSAPNPAEAIVAEIDAIGGEIGDGGFGS